MSGCAGGSEKPNPAAVKRYADQGYVPERRFETTSAQETWTIGSKLVDVVLLAPAPPGTYPVVIYLPGLGEPASAGLAWRQAWARAGYAVVSAQPSQYGPEVWSSRLARAGDFISVARDAFSASSLQARTQLMQDLLDRISRPPRSGGGSAFDRIDASRVAVAGYDLGAQTAMIVAGENVRGVEPLRVPAGVKCIVAISPYADFSGMGMERNFESVRLPVLSVTGPLDKDAYGLVTSAPVRRAPYQYMPAGQKYLLVLPGVPHSLLAGAGPATGGEPKGGAKGAPAPTREAGPDADAMSDEGSPADEDRPNQKRRARSAGGRGPNAAEQAKVQTQVQSVTTAFLDAIVKDDSIASEWLNRNAKRWLGDSAELTWK
ncbi:MAG TPA: hypothetical protein VMH32_17515 [Burkholderiales bacterium]|nr:hypothetical protein [Burkholderiales bacterium]